MRNAVLIGLVLSTSIACSDSGTPGSGTGGGAGTSGGSAGGSGATGAGGSGVVGSGGVSGAGASGGGAGAAGAGAAGASGSGAGGAAGTGASAGTGGAGAAAGTAGGAGTGGSGGSKPDGGPDTGPFPPVTDFQAPGPFGSTTVTGTGPNNGYTIYRPQQLAPNGAKNPIVGWMSGGATSHTGYTLLPHLATHGFVVVAADVVPGIGQEVALGQQIVAGIDWAIAEAARQGSPWFEKLDTTKVASMGYSMGSLATFTIANNAKLTTTVHISGGNMMPERVNNLRAPAAFLCGKTGTSSCNILSPDCDIAAVNCDTDFSGAKTPVFYGNFAGGHLGVLTSPHMERIRGVTTAWLRWQLMQDSTLRAMFAGPQCTLCADTNWKVQQKNL
jgi:hypothetical protein